MTGVFTIFNHLTNIGVMHDIIIVIVRWIQYNFFIIDACDFLGLEFFDTLSKSLDFFNEFFFGMRHFNENSGREWVSHILDEKYKYSYKLRCYLFNGVILPVPPTRCPPFVPHHSPKTHMSRSPSNRDHRQGY